MRRARAFPRRRSGRLLEALESRLLLTTYSPAQVRAAYGFNLVSADGSGETIAIVNAYSNPNIASDLDTFNRNFSLVEGGPTLFDQYGPASGFLTVTTVGTTRFDPGWAMETALDVQWTHAIAPGAKIVLVEARSNAVNDLLAAVDYARALPDVSVVSMSWGAMEWSGQKSLNKHFTTPGGHQGVTFVAASGDTGAGVGWPSISSNVVSVGGTSLNLTNNSYIGETAWWGSGGGYSSFESKPSYQKSVNSTKKRSNPDVSYNADSGTGFYVYNSDYFGQAGWFSVGGTSAGTPQWAGLIAIANQLRGPAGSLTSSQTLSKLYTMPSSNFNDIVAGSNGFAAKSGYDLATGRGTPIANLVISSLVSDSQQQKTTAKSATTQNTKSSGTERKSSWLRNRGFQFRAMWSYEIIGPASALQPKVSLSRPTATATSVAFSSFLIAAPTAAEPPAFSVTLTLTAVPDASRITALMPLVAASSAGARMPYEERIIEEPEFAAAPGDADQPQKSTAETPSRMSRSGEEEPEEQE